MPLSLSKDCVRETGGIDISRFLGLWTGDAVDLTVIVAKLGQLLLNIGNRPGAVTAPVVPSST